jgi:hypothetical protein
LTTAVTSNAAGTTIEAQMKNMEIAVMTMLSLRRHRTNEGAIKKIGL